MPSPGWNRCPDDRAVAAVPLELPDDRDTGPQGRIRPRDSRVNQAGGRCEWCRAGSSKTTYGEWLARQPAAVQEDVLGPARYKLFSKGELSIDRFVDDDSRT